MDQKVGKAETEILEVSKIRSQGPSAALISRYQKVLGCLWQGWECFPMAAPSGGPILSNSSHRWPRWCPELWEMHQVISDVSSGGKGPISRILCQVGAHCHFQKTAEMSLLLPELPGVVSKPQTAGLDIYGSEKHAGYGCWSMIKHYCMHGWATPDSYEMKNQTAPVQDFLTAIN